MTRKSSNGSQGEGTCGGRRGVDGWRAQGPWHSFLCKLVIGASFKGGTPRAAAAPRGSTVGRARSGPAPMPRRPPRVGRPTAPGAPPAATGGICADPPTPSPRPLCRRGGGRRRGGPPPGRPAGVPPRGGASPPPRRAVADWQLRGACYCAAGGHAGRWLAAPRPRSGRSLRWYNFLKLVKEF